MKIAFFWTAEFSRNILSSILKQKDIEVSLVVSQADKAIWRKKEIQETPLKKLAIENNINVLQPEKLKTSPQPSPSQERGQEQINLFIEELKSLNLDFIVVVAYWKIVPKEVLEASKYWCINIHGSLLPKYRWASPIQEAIKNWDKKTGLTIMYMSEWMDEWDILNVEEVDINKEDKTEDIFTKFEDIWPKLLIKTLNQIISWSIIPQKQDESKASYCSKISKQDWEINWSEENAFEIFNKYKAYSLWPQIFTYFNSKKLTIEECDYSEIDLSNDTELKIWDVIEIENEHWPKNKQIWVITKSWILILKQVKLEWKKSIDILSFINWYKDFLDYNFL